MLWTQLKLLFPTYVGYWLFVFALASAAWWAWTRIYRHYTFKWAAPALISVVALFYMIGSTVVGYYQTVSLGSYQQTHNTSPAAAAGKNQSPAQETALQAKIKFLKLVESFASNPDQVTPDAKQKLFASYASLFKDPQAKAEYEKAIESVYGCQRIFWEDALASFKAKEAIKSDSRKDCEKMSGAFFNRAKLIPDETIKSNEQTIASFAAHKRVPASDGKMVEINEDMIRNIVDAQMRAVDAIKKLFQ